MIVNKLKPCCDNCSFIDGTFRTEEINCVIGTSNVISTIYCEHMSVCKPYIESMKNEVTHD